MPPTRTSLRSFLTTAKNTLRSQSPQSSPLTFVIGNESADLDSLCSAVVLAYLRTYTSTSTPSTLYIPLSNLPRADLSLRPELHPVLTHSNLTPNDLITLSDLPSTPLAADKTKWILVDHNALQGNLGQIYSSRVGGCIDHHDEENQVPQDCGSEPRVVRKSGSCASLVVEYCKSAWDSLATKSTTDEKLWDAELAKLALAPVLIDTTNLTQESKTTDTDREGVEYLERWITVQGGDYERTAYFDEITSAKEDIGRLSLEDILRKDYKQWTEGEEKPTLLGISSVVKDMQFLLEKAGSHEKFFEDLDTFAKERNLSICTIMTTSHPDGEFKRELFVWARDQKGVEAVKKFEAEAKEKLGLESWSDGALDLDDGEQWRRCWRQEKVENSRKQVAPLLRSAICE